MAAKFHPDVNKQADAEEKFKKIQEAWEVLSDPQKKAQYDRFGSTGGGFGQGGFGGFNAEDFGDFAGGFSGTGGLGDIFETFFGGGMGSQQRQGPQRGRNIHGEARISFLEAVSGKDYTVSVETFVPCKTCDGTGRKKGTGTKECATCSGMGQVRRQQHTPLGVIQTSVPCPDCKGEGRIPEHPCPDCAGTGRIRETKKVTIDIPPGIFDGALLRVPGKGEAGERGQTPGDFLLRVHVMPDKDFRRENNDIHTDVEISLLEAVLGNERRIRTVHGETTIVIPRGTQPSTVLRLRSKGMPVLNKNAHGDHFVHLQVHIPKKLSHKQKKLFHELMKESGENLKLEKGFFEGLFS
jgi:molecular chaperone DnaJ